MSNEVLVPPDAGLDPEGITSQSGSNFLAGFVCLDARRRKGMTVVYAFCRVVDDAVDESPDTATARGRLTFWHEELMSCEHGQPRTKVGLALQQSIREFGVPVKALEDLVAGCAMDLSPDGISDQAELELYCYRVASAVGLACLPILGATSDGAKRFAHALGQALQFTNVLRDLRGDAEIGRCYVPKTWLDEFEITSSDLLGTGDARHYVAGGGATQICDRLAATARSHFAKVRAELLQLPRKERRALVAARIMGAIYGDLLGRLERRGGVLLVPRIRVPRRRKLWLAVSVWLGWRA
jgi:15-cis-phytoene synthase